MMHEDEVQARRKFFADFIEAIVRHQIILLCFFHRLFNS